MRAARAQQPCDFLLISGAVELRLHRVRRGGDLTERERGREDFDDDGFHRGRLDPAFRRQVHWKVFGGKSSSIYLKTMFDFAREAVLNTRLPHMAATARGGSTGRHGPTRLCRQSNPASRIRRGGSCVPPAPTPSSRARQLDRRRPTQNSSLPSHCKPRMPQSPSRCGRRRWGRGNSIPTNESSPISDASMPPSLRSRAPGCQ